MYDYASEYSHKSFGVLSLVAECFGQCCPCPYLGIMTLQKLCKLVVRIPTLCACDYPKLSCLEVWLCLSELHIFCFQEPAREHREYKRAYLPLVCTPTGCKHSLCHFRNPFGTEPKSDHLCPQDLQSCRSFQICCFVPFFPLIKNNRSLCQIEVRRKNAWMIF